MPRAASGVYTAPSNSWNPAVEGTVIDETDFNELLTDIEAEMTVSVWTSASSASDRTVLVADGTSGRKIIQAPTTIDANGQVGLGTSGRVRSATVTIADDAVGTLTVPQNGGALWVMAGTDGAAPDTTVSALIAYDAASAGGLGVTSLVQASGIGTVGTSTLSGTTGTDVRLNIAVQSASVQLENRLGASTTFTYIWVL